MMQQEPKFLSEQHTKWIVKTEILSYSSKEYTQFALEATMEDYLLDATNKL